MAFITVSLFLTLFISACGSSKKEQVSETDKLIIGVMSSMDYLPIAVAQQSGYFSDNGLEVEIHKFYSANERDAALQSNNLDGSILDYTGGAIQLAGGIPLYFTSQCDGTFELIVSNSSNINSVSDLKDKKIAVSRNTVIDFCTDLAMQKSGLKSDDAELIEINKIPLRLEMLNNDKIDASMLPDPFASIAKRDGNKSIISMSDLDVRVTGIAFLQKTMDEKPEALKKLYIAYNKAVEKINASTTGELEEILTKELGFPADAVPLIVLPKFSTAQLPQQTDLAEVEKWLKAKELIKKDFDISTIVADGFIP